jgi:hypothetical protein
MGRVTDNLFGAVLTAGRETSVYVQNGGSARGY